MYGYLRFRPALHFRDGLPGSTTASCHNGSTVGVSGSLCGRSCHNYVPEPVHGEYKMEGDTSSNPVVWKGRPMGPGRPWPRGTAAAIALSAVMACGDGSEEPATISVTPDSVTLWAPGDTARFTAEVLDRNGQVMVGHLVDLASGEPSVATVEPSGLATAVADGTTRITATAGSASARADVRVITSRGTLIELYQATGGPDWADNTGWLSTGPLAGWYGVATNEDGRHVAGLNLAGNLLSGELPPSIRNLIELEVLSLADNQLTGSIPESLGDLSRTAGAVARRQRVRGYDSFRYRTAERVAVGRERFPPPSES